MQNQSFEQLLDAMQDKLNILSATPAVRPTKGWVTSCFGPRKSPFTGLKEFHSGMDIANREGEPVIATGDGVVTFAGKKGFLGKMLVIDHGHGMVTRYGHLSEVRPKRGAAVKRGEVIGAIGATGRSTGPHLHYEVLLNGVPVNPERYILN
jgi:murein DD-endopeptidase MepM/ murein hydrolase activator NlpD